MTYAIAMFVITSFVVVVLISGAILLATDQQRFAYLFRDETMTSLQLFTMIAVPTRRSKRYQPSQTLPLQEGASCLTQTNA